MNSTTNKAHLWDQCIQQGIFNNLNKEDITKIQNTFENTVRMFDSRTENINILNKEFFIFTMVFVYAINIILWIL
jgi:hypothetical protein